MDNAQKGQTYTLFLIFTLSCHSLLVHPCELLFKSAELLIV